MKWMYLEQETKEAYLRAILCDPPEVIEQKDNDELGIPSHRPCITSCRSTECGCKSQIESQEKGDGGSLRRSVSSRKRCG
jgi:hypothetical protein